MPSGRFDLPGDEGTCYFGSSRHVAAMERVGRFTAQHVPVPADLIEGRVVSEVDGHFVPARAVDLTHERGGVLGITGELFTMSGYYLPQAWALALHLLGYEAVLYPPRFAPGGEALACFGPSGPASQPVADSVPLREVLADIGVRVSPIPSTAQIEIVTPE